jgi:hypothetical protein
VPWSREIPVVAIDQKRDLAAFSRGRSGQRTIR